MKQFSIAFLWQPVEERCDRGYKASLSFLSSVIECHTLFSLPQIGKAGGARLPKIERGERAQDGQEDDQELGDLLHGNFPLFVFGARPLRYRFLTFRVPHASPEIIIISHFAGARTAAQGLSAAGQVGAFGSAEQEPCRCYTLPSGFFVCLQSKYAVRGGNRWRLGQMK